MKQFNLIILFSSLIFSKAGALKAMERNTANLYTANLNSSVSILSKSDSILFQFLKQYVKDTAVKKVLLISGDQLKLNDSLIHFVNSNHWILILNNRTYSPTGSSKYEDSFLNQTLPCTELSYYENKSETGILFGHSDIKIGFADLGLSAYRDNNTYVWNKNTRTFTIAK